MRRLVLLVISFILLTAAPSAAQQIDFGMQCLIAPFRACATIRIEAVYHAPETLFGSLDATELRFTLSNLQGSPGFAGAHGLKEVVVNGLEVTTGTAFNLFSEVHSTSGTVTTGAALDLPLLNYTSSTHARATFNFDYDSYLFGCAVANGSSPFGGYDTTCGGSITYSQFFLNEHLELSGTSSVQLSWTGYEEGLTANDGYIGTANCTSGVDCASSVTPEPMSMTLLATGLAGLAALRGLRRRRKTSGA
jgi:MYXO-CTERM domain-containing protein